MKVNSLKVDLRSKGKSRYSEHPIRNELTAFPPGLVSNEGMLRRPKRHQYPSTHRLPEMEKGKERALRLSNSKTSQPIVQSKDLSTRRRLKLKVAPVHSRMVRQTRLTDLLAMILELDKLVRMDIVHRGGDIPPRVRHDRPTRRVGRRQRVRAAQVEGAVLGVGAVQAAARDGGARHGDGQGQLLRGGGPVRADLAGRDAELLLAEHVAGEDVGDAEDDDEDAGGDDDAPVGGAERLLARGFLVQVPEDGDAGDDHEEAEGDEAVGRGEERPVAGDVAFEDGQFGQDEEHCEVREDLAVVFLLFTLFSWEMGGKRDLLLRAAVTTWLTASKKKNFETMKVLTSIEKLATTTARRPVILQTRRMLRMTYPGPARGFLKKGILGVRRRER